MLMVKILVIILLGVIYYVPTMNLMMILQAKSMTEVEEMKQQALNDLVNNRFMLIILEIIRIPLLIIFFIPLFIHIFRLTIKEEAK